MRTNKLGGRIFGRAYSVRIKITVILHKLISLGLHFQEKPFVAQLRRLPCNTAFLNTSNGLFFLWQSETVIPKCSSK